MKDWEAPKFHMLPKIHTINNPGRPIDSSIGCHSASISKIVDCDLQLIVKNMQDCYLVRNVRDLRTFAEKSGIDEVLVMSGKC